MIEGKRGERPEEDKCGDVCFWGRERAYTVDDAKNRPNKIRKLMSCKRIISNILFTFFIVRHSEGTLSRR